MTRSLRVGHWVATAIPDPRIVTDRDNHADLGFSPGHPVQGQPGGPDLCQDAPAVPAGSALGGYRGRDALTVKAPVPPPAGRAPAAEVDLSIGQASNALAGMPNHVTHG